jgi:hypothetical protein
MARFGLAAVAASAALLAGASSAGAATVDNPGAFNASFTSGSLTVLDNTATVPLPSAVTAAGTIDQDGHVSIAAGGVTFPAFHADVVPGMQTVDVQLISDGASGTLAPASGALSLTLRAHVLATLNGVLLTDTCRVGTAASPFEIPLTTGTSGPATGTAYSAADGTLTVVNRFTLAGGVVDCDDPSHNATVASIIGAGSNDLKLSGALSPVIKPFAAKGNDNPPANNNPPAQPNTPAQQGPPQVGLPAPCIVPKLKGLTLAKAKKSLTKAACRTGKVTKKKSSKKKGTVIASSPASGKTLATGAKVALTISDGPAKKKKKSRKK